MRHLGIEYFALLVPMCHSVIDNVHQMVRLTGTLRHGSCLGMLHYNLKVGACVKQCGEEAATKEWKLLDPVGADGSARLGVLLAMLRHHGGLTSQDFLDLETGEDPSTEKQPDSGKAKFWG